MPNPCGSGRLAAAGGGGTVLGVIDLSAKSTRMITGAGPTLSADGGTSPGWPVPSDGCALMTSATLTGAPKTIRTANHLDAPALSPDGSRIAYQLMTSVGSSTDWDLRVRSAGRLAVSLAISSMISCPVF